MRSRGRRRKIQDIDLEQWVDFTWNLASLLCEIKEFSC